MTKRPYFFEKWSYLKFNKLGLAIAMALQFYTSKAKILKHKFWKGWGLIPLFIEVTGEKLVRKITSNLDQSLPQWYFLDPDEDGQAIILCNFRRQRDRPNQLILQFQLKDRSICFGFYKIQASDPALVDLWSHRYWHHRKLKEKKSPLIRIHSSPYNED